MRAIALLLWRIAVVFQWILSKNLSTGLPCNLFVFGLPPSMPRPSSPIRDLLNSQGFEKLAGGLGFEPRLAESESAVLPLDDPPAEGCDVLYI